MKLIFITVVLSAILSPVDSRCFIPPGSDMFERIFDSIYPTISAHSTDLGVVKDGIVYFANGYHLTNSCIDCLSRAVQKINGMLEPGAKPTRQKVFVHIHKWCKSEQGPQERIDSVWRKIAPFYRYCLHLKFAFVANVCRHVSFLCFFRNGQCSYARFMSS
jgi:hypothetical protein